MTALLIVLAVALGCAVAALTIVALRSQLATGPSLASKTVIVHTTDDKSLRGVLVAHHSDRVSLREAIYLFESGDQPVGGVAHVPVTSISWMQELAEPGAE